MSVAPISVLLIAFPGFNTLDLNGPLEILANAALQPNPFTITIAAEHELTTAFENVVIKRRISLGDAKKSLEEYDILIQPGGGPDTIIPHLCESAELLEILAAFAKLGPSSRPCAGERVIMSICTGALFCGYIGVFDGLQATTHHLALDQLKKVCGEYVARTPGAKGTDIIQNSPPFKLRYVDAGYNTSNVRVISSGGISCGLDATLYLVSLRLGKCAALSVASMMEYNWQEATR
jgi:transcriptional regulator GlxA family with amidase domain